MERKSDRVRRLVECGDFKGALKIAKDFRLGIEVEDSDAMQRAYECILYPGFYQQIGIDVDRTVQKGVETVKRLYGT